jgi:ubiquinone biosynthesis protein UbiJ
MQTLLETIINHMFALDPSAQNHLQLLARKCLEINIQDGIFLKKIFCLFNAKGTHLSLTHIKPADMIITGNTRAFLKLILRQDPYGSARLGLTFEGDVVLLETVQQLFFGLSIDWEEALSQCTGDIIAHQIGKLLRYAKKQRQSTLTNTIQSVSEYLQEESKVSPTKTEINNFLNSVDTLRARIDRLQAKIEYVSLSNNKDLGE